MASLSSMSNTSQCVSRFPFVVGTELRDLKQAQPKLTAPHTEPCTGLGSGRPEPSL